MPDGSRSGAVQRREISGKQVKFFLLETKALNETADAWQVRGVATTPRTDRMGDVVEPDGAIFEQMPKLMLYHDSRRPIGNLTQAKVTRGGIPFTASIPKVAEPGVVRDRIDEAVHSIKYDLMSYVSIGFNPLEWEPINPKEPFGAQRFTKWEWLELSVVTIPANPDAVITGIKAIDDELRKAQRVSPDRNAQAATGSSAPVTPSAGDSAFKAKGNAMKSIPERLAELQGDRAEKSARMEELFKGCDGEFDKLEADQRDEYDALTDDVEKLDTDIRRLRGMQVAAEKATPVSRESGMDPQRASRVRQGDFTMKSSLPKGIAAFTCAVIAQARAVRRNMSVTDAIQIAKHEWPGAPEVAEYIAGVLKANAGTGVSGNWAETLNVANTVEGQFLELLRPATILGRINFRPAPFNVKMIRQTSGSTVNWVGKAAAKPVGEQAYDTVTVDQSKIAGIVVLTDDQIMTSHIDSVAAVQNDLIAQIAEFADEQLTDPTVAAVTGTNPASLTNGVNDIVSGGTTADALRHDLFSMLKKFSAANIPLTGLTLVMSSFAASGAAMLVNALGQAEFPDITVNGGTLRGFRVIVSDNVGGDSTGSNIIGIIPSEVLLAQNGGVRVDMSRDATIDMAGGNSPTFSLFQKNAVALRAEWWVSWIKARAEAVQYISGAAYAPAVS